ncbi:MAG: transglutaminase family protein [Planctomycetales bacterium]|nr:transglutaminase family protein [Planctomycetales bacterium]
MPRIRVHSLLEYQVRRPTTLLFKVAVQESPGQSVVDESFACKPSFQLDSGSNGPAGDRLHRLHASNGEFSLEYSATVELDNVVEPPCEVEELDLVDLPAGVLPYLNPSRYCESDLLQRFAYEEFGDLSPGYGRVRAITDWVHEHLEYTPGSTNGLSTASDVLLSRTGVCRDYAHLAVALCRGMGIPARYLSVYAVDLHPQDFHGVFEAYLGEQWYLFDATRLAPRGGFVRIGAGRDAADVAFATIVGNAALNDKQVSAELLDDSKLEAPGSSDAVTIP